MAALGGRDGTALAASFFANVVRHGANASSEQAFEGLLDKLSEDACGDAAVPRGAQPCQV